MLKAGAAAQARVEATNSRLLTLLREEVEGFMADHIYRKATLFP